MLHVVYFYPHKAVAVTAYGDDVPRWGQLHNSEGSMPFWLEFAMWRGRVGSEPWRKEKNFIADCEVRGRTL
jgi:hypothetical protein